MSEDVRCQVSGTTSPKGWVRRIAAIVLPFILLAIVFVQGCRFTSLRKQAEAHAARGDRILLSSPVPTISCDVHGNILLYNKAAEDVFGWTAEEVHGDVVDRLVPDDAKAAHRKAFALAVQVLRESKQDWAITKRRVPTVVLRKDGRMTGVDMTIRGIHFGDNEIEFIAVFRDTSLPSVESKPFEIPVKPGP